MESSDVSSGSGVQKISQEAFAKFAAFIVIQDSQYIHEVNKKSLDMYDRIDLHGNKIGARAEMKDDLFLRHRWLIYAHGGIDALGRNAASHESNGAELGLLQ